MRKGSGVGGKKHNFCTFFFALFIKRIPRSRALARRTTSGEPCALLGGAHENENEKEEGTSEPPGHQHKSEARTARSLTCTESARPGLPESVGRARARARA